MPLFLRIGILNQYENIADRRIKLQHLEAFRKICSQNTSSWAKMFDQNPRLLGQMLYLGSHYENVEPQTAGESLCMLKTYIGMPLESLEPLTVASRSTPRHRIATTT